MENSTVTNITLNSRYRIKIERAASTKGVLGYVVEASGDDIPQLISEVALLKGQAEMICELSAFAGPAEKKEGRS